VSVCECDCECCCLIITIVSSESSNKKVTKEITSLDKILMREDLDP
jgi:hypothetical protein